MVDAKDPYAPLQAPGISVRVDRSLHVATLRYFDAQGAFAQACHAALGVPLPTALHAFEVPGTPAGVEFILAWRHPTQTLVLSNDGASLAALQSELSAAVDGVCLDQSGGLWVMRVQGERTRDLLLRIGSEASVPAPGEARISRIAELPVLSLSVKPGETLLLVDRVYAEHLLNWIRVTLADFDPSEVS
jgi:sarcosine oxidase gamma subunit